MEDSIPETAEGQILALADKLDTLRECFKIGLVPTGSKDPFALRRAAQGVVKILAEAKLGYSIRKLFDGQLADFVIERVHYYFREIRGFKYDEVNAVIKAGISTLKNVEERLQLIHKVRHTPDFEALAVSFKRINNILKQANFTGGGVFHVHMLQPGPEKELYDAYDERAFGPFENIASLRPFVDRYFDTVMVNVPDEAVRTNRLSMLSDMLRKFSTVADFSEIVTPGDQK